MFKLLLQTLIRAINGTGTAALGKDNLLVMYRKDAAAAIEGNRLAPIAAKDFEAYAGVYENILADAGKNFEAMSLYLILSNTSNVNLRDYVDSTLNKPDTPVACPSVEMVHSFIEAGTLSKEGLTPMNLFWLAYFPHYDDLQHRLRSAETDRIFAWSPIKYDVQRDEWPSGYLRVDLTPAQRKAIDGIWVARRAIEADTLAARAGNTAALLRLTFRFRKVSAVIDRPLAKSLADFFYDWIPLLQKIVLVKNDGDGGGVYVYD